jgi:ABC-type Zn uptake system ZnuABC Zn-binding protein ZnuA
VYTVDGGNDLSPAELVAISLAAGKTLQVATTTSIIGDVVANVGGDAITLFTLIEPGVDPHSYATTPQALRTLSAVDLIFVNGLHLEEGLESALVGAGVPLISVNALVVPLAGAEIGTDNVQNSTEHDHGPSDPHTWQSVPNVQRWVEQIEAALSAIDPAHADTYHANAAAYQLALEELDLEIRVKVATIPAEKRKLVTDHETFNYFAHEYGFMVTGALVGSLSSTATSAAKDFAALQDQIRADEISAIFVGTTANPALAEQLANDLHIVVVPLYTDALSDPAGPAATYLEFMRYNVNAVVAALQPD